MGANYCGCLRSKNDEVHNEIRKNESNRNEKKVSFLQEHPENIAHQQKNIGEIFLELFDGHDKNKKSILKESNSKDKINLNVNDKNDDILNKAFILENNEKKNANKFLNNLFKYNSSPNLEIERINKNINNKFGENNNDNNYNEFHVNLNDEKFKKIGKKENNENINQNNNSNNNVWSLENNNENLNMNNNSQNNNMLDDSNVQNPNENECENTYEIID